MQGVDLLVVAPNESVVALEANGTLRPGDDPAADDPRG
jgi:hypothetical protein